MKTPLNGICLLAGILLLSTFLLNMFGCAGAETKILATINQSASLVSQLPANPLQWKIITSAINKADSTMSTLYGNDPAVSYARANSRHNYPTGSVLSLVTWTQREDDRWFGAKIPDQVKSVEFVFVDAAGDGRQSYSYQEYEGRPLTMVSEQKGFTPNDRTAYLLAQERLCCRNRFVNQPMSCLRPIPAHILGTFARSLRELVPAPANILNRNRFGDHSYDHDGYPSAGRQRK